ncbi:MAG: bifunctional phosphoribosylaminoimidazolecarboxamide formyltransferase/IMP cyclohydrolase, partial [Chloroflexi bacterium]|nr:bifunctional phosphoribosylaminoimidazolecarboxamide formyltransferase/IMP cyclohydrolase [Chloroflexota bacterium]
HGKELSYNNILDLDAAWMTASEFNQPAAVIVKHTNPCGVAIARSLVDAYKSALSGDPLSAYGGIVALNRVVDLTTAMAINEIFTECVIAPGYENDALSQLRQKKNLRVLVLDRFGIPAIRLAGITGGVLIQDPDLDDPSNWDSVSKRPPTPHEMEALRFAWQVVKHVKSNAIVLAKDTSLTAMVTVGVGAGQMSRVDAVRIAIEKAGERAKGAVMASDAFFPFADGVELAVAAGVTAIVQPGGSVRDQEIIAVVDSANAAMVITGVRHFRH